MSTALRSLAGFTLAGVLAVLSATPLGAQDTTAEISGTVTDPSGAVLGGVTVTLSGIASAEERTDASGTYRFGGLSPGSYDLSFSLAGFAPETRSLDVSAGASAVENVALPALMQGTVAVMVDVAAPNVITNEATVSTSTPEGNPGDESAVEETTVTSRADLVITSQDSVDPVIAGTTLTYIVTVENKGPSHARFIEVTDTLPAEVTLGSTSGCAEDPVGLPICSLGTIEAETSKQFTVTATVAASATGVITNQVSVGSQTLELVPGNESASENTEVDTRADLVITTSDSIDPVIAGHLLTYTVEVTNNGPSDARDVVVTDTVLSEGTSDSTVGCQEDPGGVPTCTLGTVAAGTSKQYTVSVPAGSGATSAITNQVTVTSSTTEVNPGDESASEETTVSTIAALEITSRDSVDPVIAGTTLTYTLTVTNNGPSDARGVEVTSDLSAAVTGGSTSGCAEDPGGVPTCTLGALPAGASKQYSIAVTVDSATTAAITSEVSVGSATAGTNSGNESTTEETAVETRADLVLTNRDSVDPVIAGRPLTYTVTVTNNGPSDARDVEIGGTLPAAVTFLSRAGCAEDDGPGGGVSNCILGTIAAGSSKQYHVSVMVSPDATGVIANQAIATSTTTEDKPGDESAPASPAGESPASELDEVVRAWAQAWASQQIEKYLGFYAAGFIPEDGIGRDEWVAQRRERLREPQTIRIELSGLEAEIISSERGRVSFDQGYSSSLFNDNVRKTLELVREDGRWKILKERAEG